MTHGRRKQDLAGRGSHSVLVDNFVVSYNWSIPFERAFTGAPKRLTRGWNLVGISRFSNGFPITIRQSPGDYSLIGESATAEAAA